MIDSSSWIAGLALASFVFVAPAGAQDSGSVQVGNTTVTVGGGTAALTLPDVPSIMLRGQNILPVNILQTYKSSDDFGDEIGWNVNGSIEVPVAANQTVSLNGFWGTIDNSNSATCTAVGASQRCLLAPLVDDPGSNQTNAIAPVGTVDMNSRGEREVNHWGASVESKWTQTPGVMGVTQAPPRRYISLGIDIRGIDQDLTESIAGGSVAATYREDLDTRYYGAYAAWGRDYSFPFLSGMAGGLGLQTSFLLRGGVYYADADYSGRISTNGGGNPGSADSALSLSRDDMAFIGGLVLETCKPLGRRAMLSLKSEYEYYSWVPEMAYNQRDQNVGGVSSPNGQAGTRIGDDDAFSARTLLRLTIGLGPKELYQ